MSLDIWSVLILIFTAQGVFTLTVLVISPKRRTQKANTFLFILILFVIWILIEFLAIRNVYKVNIDLFYGTRYGAWFIMGPLIYYYYKSITYKDRKFTPKTSLHIVPFIVFTIIIPLFSTTSLSIRQITYGMLAVFDYRPKTVTWFEYLYSTIFYLQFIHLGIYLILNIRILKNYTTKLKNEYSNINDVIWLKIFNSLLIATLMLSSLYLYILFVSDYYSRSLDYIYVLPMGLFIYSIGYHLAGINWLPVQQTQKKYSTSSLKENIKQASIVQLELLMNTEKIYLQNDLRVKDLAAKLDISRHHLSQLINEHYSCSFFDYVNRFRIQEAKVLIKEFPEKNLLQVAFDSGFNNKTSFVNAFKKFEQTTPSTFRKKT